jgi:EmrB/QacA subfamily drug resistance transporter
MTSVSANAGDHAVTKAMMPTPTSHPRATLVVTVLASTLGFIDASALNVALPAIGRDLHADPAGLQWTINAYWLPLSALLLFGGAAGDHFGRRRILIAGMLLFLIASVGCAFAPDLPALLIARAIQGVGAAMLIPNSLAILGSAFTGKARGKAIGLWAAAGSIGTTLGPLLAGALIENVGWRTIFLINIPVAAGAIVGALHYVGESRTGGQVLDWLGAVIVTFALGLVAWALTDWTGGHGGIVPAAAMAAGLLAFVVFVLVEDRQGPDAMIPLSMFASKPLVGITLLTFLVYGSLSGFLVLLPYVLITTAGYTALQMGLALVPFPLIIGLGSPFAGRAAVAVGSRLPLSISPLIVGAGMLLLLRVDADATYLFDVLPAIAVIAIGMAGTAAPLTTAILGAVDAARTGTASGLNSATSRTGGLIVTALTGTVIARHGPAMIDAFHVAAVIGAAMAGGAALIAYLFLSPFQPKN